MLLIWLAFQNSQHRFSQIPVDEAADVQQYNRVDVNIRTLIPPFAIIIDKTAKIIMMIL